MNSEILKPHFPEEVYEGGALLYTIVDYVWVPLGSLILEPGWFPIKEFNYNHPLMVEELKKVREESERSLRNKNMNWDKLSRVYINI